VDPEQPDRDVVNAFRAEVSLWRPNRVPDLVELTERLANSWRRPVALASATGAVALALLLLVSLVVIALVPAGGGWAGVVKDHLSHMP
jgi:hypothetical protein